MGTAESIELQLGEDNLFHFNVWECNQVRLSDIKT